jgi:predicted DNA-binding WGR domain protein
MKQSEAIQSLAKALVNKKNRKGYRPKGSMGGSKIGSKWATKRPMKPIKAGKATLRGTYLK